MFKNKVEYVKYIYTKYSNADIEIFDYTPEDSIPDSMIEILKDVEEKNKNLNIVSSIKPIGAVRLNFITYIKHENEVYLISPTTKFKDVLVYRLKDGKAIYLQTDTSVEILEIDRLNAQLTGDNVMLDRKGTRSGTVFYHEESDSLIIKVEEVAVIGSDSYPFSYCVHFINLMTGEDYRETTKFILDNPILPTVELDLNIQ